MTAILFGSISTIADTSELQREAFNRAFAKHGLTWHWEREEYQSLLNGSGGKKRIAEYAKKTGDDVDAAAIHASKSKIFQESFAAAPLSARPGVAETVAAARSAGIKLGFVSLTSQDNLDALFSALEPQVRAEDFDLMLNADSAPAPKPDPGCYAYAVQTLGERAGDCVAIEDNVPGVEAAIAAGLVCVAFANENTAHHDFGIARRVDRVDFEQLQQLIHSA